MKADGRIKEIFAQALERKSPAEREKYLADVCQGDPDSRREVESLLRAAEQAGDFLRQTIKVPESNFVLEEAGTRIGRYKLLEQIGEGGFGVVYMAEQEEPVRRQVALKIIKLGMDTKEVIARFEAERQALAMMDHPNIARVFDARCHGTRAALFRDGTGQWHPHHGLLRREPTLHARAAGAVHAGLPRGPARAPERHHSSRPEAVQRFGHCARRRPGPESDRFRRRQGDPGSALRRKRSSLASSNGSARPPT